MAYTQFLVHSLTVNMVPTKQTLSLYLLVCRHFISTRQHSDVAISALHTVAPRFYDIFGMNWITTTTAQYKSPHVATQRRSSHYVWFRKQNTAFAG
jgi:hypothetical protein